MSDWIKEGPNLITNVPVREGFGDAQGRRPQEAGAETGIILPRAKKSQGPKAIRRGKDRFPRAFGGSVALLTA